jgi:adenine nucleotide transporter 17
MKTWTLRWAGFLGFFHGLRTKIVQSILAAALLMAIKEELTNSTRALLNATAVPVDDD